MRALVFHGTKDVRVDVVPDPKIIDDTDIIVKVTLTAICGSDLHLYGGYIPLTEKGDIFGHEFMGEIVDVGSKVTKHKKGDRVIVPFTIACGHCFFCKQDMWSLCDESNPNRDVADKMFGYAGSGIYGYSHLFGGYAGGQAEYVRVPFADTDAFAVPSDLPDEKVLFLTDIFPTGYMAAENCDIKDGDTVAVWGAGPVGQFAIRSALMLGAKRVIAIDRFPERLAMAKAAGAEIINYEDGTNVYEALKEKTKHGPDACIDAVGMEAHGAGALNGFLYMYDKAKQAVMLENDRPIVLREIIYACRKGAKISIAGVYSGLIDKFPMGIAMNKGLQFKMGQTHVQKYVPMLLEKIEKGEIDPSFVITHRLNLDEAPKGYQLFRDKEDECIKVVLKP